MTDEEEKIEKALRKYALHFASSEKENVVDFTRDIPAFIQVYTAYANYVTTKRLAKLTWILAYSTFALAAFAAISTAISLFLLLHH